jgi:hypothetical protein
VRKEGGVVAHNVFLFVFTSAAPWTMNGDTISDCTRHLLFLITPTLARKIRSFSYREMSGNNSR